MVQAREFRFVLVVEDYEAALGLYRDVFGFDQVQEFEGPGRGALLDTPSATLELIDREHARSVDEIEVGRPFDYTVRIAIAVDDLSEAADAVVATGADVLMEPVETPWGDRNLRLRTTDGTQLTLFQPPRTHE